MNVAEFHTPILFIVFNRPDTTQVAFENIRSIRPTQLYLAADGPRANVDGDAERCREVRRIATAVDWACDVGTLFRTTNLGCAVNVSSAISWFFENVTEGIVLEDDCVPSRSFYRFCEELLDYYREEPRVMHIAGNSYQYGRRRGDASYYFSKYANVWGWASWRRAWKSYDFTLRPSWELRDTWDTQWQLSIEKAGGVAIVPNVNLVRNIGFGPRGTHTQSLERPAFLEAAEVQFPLIHPTPLAADQAADTFTYYSHYRNVRYLRFIWLYRVQDFVYQKLKKVKRVLMHVLQRGP